MHVILAWVVVLGSGGGAWALSMMTTSPLQREWALADRVSAASAATGQVAWRRLARELGASSGRDVRQRWVQGGGSGYPLLPFLDPWEYEGSRLRGVLDGAETIELAAKPGGDTCLSDGIFVADDGTAYEVGAPSEAQLQAWAGDKPTGQLLNVRDIVLAGTLPVALASGALILGVLTHHLQVDIFVI